MNVQVPHQYAPERVLDAGLKAEGDGRLDVAARLYRHVCEHFPQRQEAAAARAGLARLAAAALPPVVAPARRPVSLAPADADWGGEWSALPPRSRRYLAGRVIARLTAAGSGLALLAALAWLTLYAFAPDLLGGLAPFAMIFPGPAIAVSAAGSALILLLLAQLARALLEQANATLDLAAIARARAEHAEGEAAAAAVRAPGSGQQ